MNKKVIFLAFMLSFLVATAFMINVVAWSNGGFSDGPSNPDYGTHDWFAQHALDWLPDEEKQYILNNLAAYLYGTELPDNGRAPDGIGDTAKHHIYYDSSGVMTDDTAAVRASTEYDNTLSFLKSGDFAKAAKNAGIMSHYIADLAVFGHVMGADTDWGKEQHHSDYENYVNQRTSSYDDEFNVFLSFDGSLDMISAYDAAKDLAYDTTFDVDGDLTCLWMDQNYDWNDPTFRDRCGESLNLAVNYLTDVLHALHSESTESTTQNHVVINEVELNPPGNDNSLDVEEWIELYNPTSKSVDISGWTLSTTHGETVSVPLPQGTVIDADGYYVYGRGAQWLDNDDESIILDDASGREIDRTPKMSDTDNNGRSWQRHPNGQDTDTASDWSFRTSTKRASNGGVAKSSSLIMCSVLPTTVTLDNPVTVSGSISPAHAGVTVSLTYTRPNATTITRTVTTNSAGSYSDTYTPDMVGSWIVVASWDGDYDHEGTESSEVPFTVEKIESSITCSVSPSTVTIGQSVEVSGAISPAHSGATVTLVYTRPDGSELTRSVGSANDGSYRDVYEPDQVGSWNVKASWVGDQDHKGAESAMQTLTVREKLLDETPPSISNVTREPSSPKPGEQVTVSAAVADEESGVDKVTLYYRLNGSTWSSKLMSQAEDTWSAAIPAQESDVRVDYYVEVIDKAGNTAESNIYSYMVAKASSSISCSVSPNMIRKGESVEVSGFITPAHTGVTVTLTYMRPDGSTFKRSVTTASDGSFRDTYTPDAMGSWSVYASWTGDRDHEGAESSFVSFVVKLVVDTTPPAANAGRDQTVKAGETMSFNASGSSDDVGIASYEWDFGDGTTGTGITTTHTYTEPGTYAVTLTVKDEAGNTDTDTMIIVVERVAAPFPWWIVGVITATGIASIAIAFWRHGGAKSRSAPPG